MLMVLSMKDDEGIGGEVVDAVDNMLMSVKVIVDVTGPYCSKNSHIYSIMLFDLHGYGHMSSIASVKAFASFASIVPKASRLGGTSCWISAGDDY